MNETPRTLSFYAVRIQDVVELRAARRKPIPRTTSLTKTTTVMVKKATYDYAGGGYLYKEVPVKQKMVLKQVYYIGGKVLGILKYNVFYAQTGVRIDVDGIQEISREQKNLGLKWRLY